MNSLKSGERGVRLTLPADGRVVEEGRNSFAFEDPRHELVWVFTLAPWQCDFDAGLTTELASELEVYTRGVFVDAFEPSDAGPPPRTDDPTWSPIIEAECVSVGTPALRVIYRRTYQPGHELIEALLIAPARVGLWTASATARARMTGMRESVLMSQLMAAGGPIDADGAPMHPGQAHFDDPKHDALFPAHPLSRLRRAQAWLLDASGGGLSVDGPQTSDERTYSSTELGFEIDVPPGYGHVPSSRLGLSSNLVFFSRSVLGAHGLRTIEVWKAPDRLKGTASVESLTRLAESTIRGWEAEGARDIEFAVRSTTPERGRITVRSHTLMTAGREPSHIAHCWMLTKGGDVFRIGVAGPIYVPEEQLWVNLDQVLPTFEVTARPKPWWKLW